MFLHQIEKPMTGAKNGMGGHAMCGQLIHVGVDMQNDGLGIGLLAQSPMHGVPFIEAGTKNDQHIDVAVENRRRRVPGARIAEDAKRELMIFGKNPFRAQRRCDRNRPLFRDGPQCRGAIVMLDTRSGEKSDFWSGRFASRASAASAAGLSSVARAL